MITGTGIYGTFNVGKGFPYISDEGLKLYLRFDNSLFDESVNSYTFVSNNIGYSSGKFNQSLRCLTGTTNPETSRNSVYWSQSCAAPYQETGCTVIDTSPANPNGFTVNLWHKFSNLPSTGNSCLWSSGGGWNPSKNFFDRNIYLEYTSTGFYRLGFYYDDTTSNSFTWNTTPNTNEWIMVTMVMQPLTGSFKVYFNGVERISGTDSKYNSGNYLNKPFLWIGSYENDTSIKASFLGYIDDFSVFDRPLSYEEIQTLYLSNLPLR